MRTAPIIPLPAGIPVAAGGAVSHPRVATHRVSLLILLALVALMTGAGIGATRHRAVGSTGASATSAVIAATAGATPTPLANGNATPTVAPLAKPQVVPAARPQPPAARGNLAPRPATAVVTPRGGDDGDDD